MCLWCRWRLGRRPGPTHKQRRRFLGFMTGAPLSHRDVSAPSAGHRRCLEIVYLQTRRSGRRRNRQLLRSQRDIAPSVRKSFCRFTGLSLIWLCVLIGQNQETVCWLRENNRERAESRNHSQPENERRTAFQRRSDKPRQLKHKEVFIFLLL